VVLRCLCACACSGLPNLAILKEHLLKEGRLTQDAALELIHRASALIKAEPNMLELKYPITGTDAKQAQPHGGGTRSGHAWTTSSGGAAARAVVIR